MNRTNFLLGTKKPIIPHPGQRWFWKMSEEEFNYPKDLDRANSIKKAHEVWRTKGVHIVSEDEQSVFVSSAWPNPRARPHPIPKNVFIRLYQFGHYESFEDIDNKY